MSKGRDLLERDLGRFALECNYVINAEDLGEECLSLVDQE